MSSDDFGTVNVRGKERAREIEILRQHYRRHRDALQRMTEDAPTEHLANEYQRLIVELDRSLTKLDELDGLVAPTPTAPPSPEPTRPHGDPLADQRPRNIEPPARPRTPEGAARRGTEPGMTPLVPPPSPRAAAASEPASRPLHPARAGLEDNTIPEADAEPRSRLPLIIGAAVLALAVIGALIWRASSDRAPATAIVEDPAAVATANDTVTDAPEPVADDTIEPSAPPLRTQLAAAPPSHDFGVVRKGTRAVRQYELSNNTEEPLTVEVARSACRCLFYEHAPVIPPRGKETLTVTIDGGRAKAGALSESIRVSSKSDTAVATNINVTATIR